MSALHCQVPSLQALVKGAVVILQSIALLTCLAFGRPPEAYAQDGIDVLTYQAMEGNVDAQLELGLAYMRGEQTGKDLVRAYVWLNIAAAGGLKEAAGRRDELEARMSRSEVAEAQQRSATLFQDLESETAAALESHSLKGSYQFPAFSSVSPVHSTEMLSRASKEVYALIHQMIRRSPTPHVLIDVEVFRSTTEPQARAYVAKDGRRVIVYNPDFVATALTRAPGQWGVLGLLAHETGHHLQFHEPKGINGEPNYHLLELHADRIAGYILARMGADQTEAVAAWRLIDNQRETKTHPAPSRRIEAVIEGWQEGRRIQREENLSTECLYDSTDEACKSAREGAGKAELIQRSNRCVTAMRDCTKEVPLIVGSTCHCRGLTFGSVYGWME